MIPIQLANGTHVNPVGRVIETLGIGEEEIAKQMIDAETRMLPKEPHVGIYIGKTC